MGLKGFWKVEEEGLHPEISSHVVELFLIDKACDGRSFN